LLLLCKLLNFRRKFLVHKAATFNAQPRCQNCPHSYSKIGICYFIHYFIEWENKLEFKETIEFNNKEGNLKTKEGKRTEKEPNLNIKEAKRTKKE
jgi:hypothetical protein